MFVYKAVLGDELVLPSPENDRPAVPVPVVEASGKLKENGTDT